MDIKKLQEKYWRGETNLEEEAMLKNYAQETQDARYFQYLNQQKKIQTNQGFQLRPKRQWMMWTAAASLALLVFTFGYQFVKGEWPVSPSESQLYADVIENEEEALEMTRKALLQVQLQLKKSEKAAQENLTSISGNVQMATSIFKKKD